MNTSALLVSTLLRGSKPEVHVLSIGSIPTTYLTLFFRFSYSRTEKIADSFGHHSFLKRFANAIGDGSTPEHRTIVLLALQSSIPPVLDARS
jgi:hypothetical protein